MTEGRFEFASPPSEPPNYPNSVALGVLSCLRTDLRQEMFRCACCGEMQQPPCVGVWVPDAVMSYDLECAVVEMCRLYASNGHYSLYCLACGRRVGRAGRTPLETAARKVKRAGGWLRRWWRGDD